MCRKLYLYCLLALCVGAFSGACQSDPSAPDEESKHIVIGVIQLAESLPTGYLRLLVGDLVEPVPSEVGFDKIWVKVSISTPIFVEDPDGSLKRAGWGDLTVDASIRAWHTDVILKSLPPIVMATRIEVAAPGSS